MAEAVFKFALLCCLLLMFGYVTTAKAVHRGRRSDDGGPLETVVNALSQKVELLSAHNTALTSQFSALQARVDAVEQPVAFTAMFSAMKITGLGKGQTLKFDKVLYNAGSGYNPTTGLFTAPSSGTYIFYLQLMRHGDDAAVSVGIYKGTVFLVRALSCCSHDEASSTAVTVHLERGEEVHLEITEGNSMFGFNDSSFSGAKLSPL